MTDYNGRHRYHSIISAEMSDETPMALRLRLLDQLVARRNDGSPRGRH